MTDWDIQITGTFDGKDKMTGSATFVGLTIGGKDITSATWMATRRTSTGSRTARLPAPNRPPAARQKR